MATPEKCLFVFTSKLGCKRTLSNSIPEDSEASNVLACFLDNDSSRCTLPSLCLQEHSSLKLPEEKSIEELKTTLDVTKQTISVAPTALLQNVCRSFGTMIDNRIKEVNLMALENKTITDKDNCMDLKLSSIMLSEKKCPTSFTSAELSFRPLAISKGFTKHVGRLKAVILPLVFKTTVIVNILGVQNLKVAITAPGTIVGTFLGSCNRLQSVDVTVDTKAVFLCMKARCDQVVIEAFETAARLLTTPTSTEQAVNPQEPKQATKSRGHVGNGLRIMNIPISP